VGELSIEEVLVVRVSMLGLKNAIGHRMAIDYYVPTVTALKREISGHGR